MPDISRSSPQTCAAFLRAIKVGGTGKLGMADLRLICEQIGFASVQTYSAGGNVVFRSSASEAQTVGRPKGAGL